MKKCILLVILMTGALGLPKAQACTGITLQTTNSQIVTARTIEWAAEPLNGACGNNLAVSCLQGDTCACLGDRKSVV